MNARAQAPLNMARAALHRQQKVGDGHNLVLSLVIK